MLLLGLIILAPVLMYYFGTPLIVFFTQKIQAHPTVDVFDPATGMPESVRENFDRRFHELSELQFQHLGTFTLVRLVKNVKTVFAVYENEEHQITAGTTAMFLKVAGQWSLRGQFVTFGTLFPDGCEVETTNINQLFPFPVMSGSVRTQHPELQSASDLFDAHRSMVENYRNGRNSVNELRSKYAGDTQKYFSDNLFADFSKAAKAGRLKLKKVESKNEEHVAQPDTSNPFRAPAAQEFTVDQGSYFVPTLKGAYIMTMIGLWPTKQIIGRFRFARDRKLLKETGYRWP